MKLMACGAQFISDLVDEILEEYEEIAFTNSLISDRKKPKFII